MILFFYASAPGCFVYLIGGGVIVMVDILKFMLDEHVSS